MGKNVVRSGVTFDKSVFKKLETAVSKSKRYKIDKSEIINVLIADSEYSIEDIQKMVMDYRERK